MAETTLRTTPTAIEFGGDVPHEIKIVVEPIVRRYLHALPLWVRHVLVQHTHNADENGSANVIVREEYRRITIRVDLSILEWLPGHRMERIVHELAHAHTCPLYNAALSAIESLPDGEKAMAKKMLEHALERSTEDLAETFLRIMPVEEEEGQWLK